MNGDGMGILTQAFKAKLWLEITCNGRNKLFYYMYVESWCIFHFLTERWEDFVENVRKIKYFEHRAMFITGDANLVTWQMLSVLMKVIKTSTKIL